jgi:RNA polymerase sigma-70 factor (ECF subfamily)
MIIRSGEKRLPLTHQKQTGDQDAFAELFERYKNLVYKTAFLMLDDANEAEEALQEVFVLVYKSLASFDPAKGALTTWLHRITLNYCLGYRRKRRFLFESLDEEASTLPSEPAEVHLAEKEVMQQAIAGLSAKQRAVVILRYYWGLPYAEIAQVLDIPLGTVKSRIDMALRALRQKLSEPEENALSNSSPQAEVDL